ncbi:uncharacterized protein LOC120418247 [Culex pipiens pallens]|uniref:uncharacterized protein LOC120418247 n=1 Tax=Culex pipiens pallens TaxID=42434 RepID=UPI0022AA846E|nr:uncharacterized protein LOC120418247 [Culex pipiens pallens]
MHEVTCIHEATRDGENTMIVPNSMCTTKPQPEPQFCNINDCPLRGRFPSGASARNLVETASRSVASSASRSWPRNTRSNGRRQWARATNLRTRSLQRQSVHPGIPEPPDRRNQLDLHPA